MSCILIFNPAHVLLRVSNSALVPSKLSPVQFFELQGRALMLSSTLPEW